MKQMFNNAARYTGGGLSSFDLSRVRTTKQMFEGATSLEGGSGIADWNIGTVEDMDQMFFGASNFEEDLCNWHSLASDAVSVTNMFQGTSCSGPADPDLTGETSFCTPC